ncbi:MAG TPA: hypothetical protein VIY28_04510 [Pseudonocardiaceae bacterium]
MAGKHKRRAASVHPVASGPRVILLTDARSRTAHRVTDDAAAAGRRSGGGRYVAVCGIEVLPASLATPERTHCSPCSRGAR